MTSFYIKDVKQSPLIQYISGNYKHISGQSIEIIYAKNSTKTNIKSVDIQIDQINDEKNIHVCMHPTSNSNNTKVKRLKLNEIT